MMQCPCAGSRDATMRLNAHLDWSAAPRHQMLRVVPKSLLARTRLQKIWDVLSHQQKLSWARLNDPGPPERSWEQWETRCDVFMFLCTSLPLLPFCGVASLLSIFGRLFAPGAGLTVRVAWQGLARQRAGDSGTLACQGLARQCAGNSGTFA